MATFTLNGATIGQDAVVTITAAPGGTYTADQLGHLMDIRVEDDFRENQIEPITHGGQPIVETIPTAVRADLDFTRSGGVLSALRAQVRQNRFAGIRTQFSMQLLVTDADGTVNTYTFVQGRLAKGSDQFPGGKMAEQRLSLIFSTYVQS